MIAQWRRWLLPAYYYGTWPLRRAGQTAAAAVKRMPLAVLYYHRVADEGMSPWTISRSDFRRQIDWLQRNFELISLAEVQRRVASGENTRPAVSITFDDGYAENCEYALPLLLSRHIPVTYFVATSFVKAGRPFPHDIERGDPRPPNSLDQLRALVQAGVELGAHTRQHRDLGPVTDADTLRDEIAGSCDDLQQWLGCTVRYFAFPYGLHANLNPHAFQIARDCRLAGVCSAYGGYNLPGDDPFHVQRLHGDPYLPRLKNWLHFEPRLLVSTARFQYASKVQERVP